MVRGNNWQQHVVTYLAGDMGQGTPDRVAQCLLALEPGSLALTDRASQHQIHATRLLLQSFASDSEPDSIEKGAIFTPSSAISGVS